MAGRPRIIRNIQSYVNHIDNNTASGPMKMGTAPDIGVSRNFWHNYQVNCPQRANAVKKSYANVVQVNINPVQTHYGTCFNVNRRCGGDKVNPFAFANASLPHRLRTYI